ncbi:hypothetical protein RHGRI_015811 [Rhododendron griersonianum]|uniref:MaoC-like domain-containing protein n=1 Tax=Rhododendron griersonianum TaxID=479676 RepID=A0AAV6JTC1_9ERIC|nr:hypothetical protein RHGRI_015811 [Rhododendron griersonianum]
MDLRRLSVLLHYYIGSLVTITHCTQILWLQKLPGKFSRPILHGLCTLGFAVRAIIRCVCKGDPNMIKIISGRFLLHVYPGETLITEMWLEGLRLFSPLFFVFVGCIPSKGEGAKQGSAFRVRRNQSFNFIPVKCFYLANE